MKYVNKFVAAWVLLVVTVFCAGCSAAKPYEIPTETRAPEWTRPMIWDFT